METSLQRAEWLDVLGKTKEEKLRRTQVKNEQGNLRSWATQNMKDWRRQDYNEQSDSMSLANQTKATKIEMETNLQQAERLEEVRQRQVNNE